MRLLLILPQTDTQGTQGALRVADLIQSAIGRLNISHAYSDAAPSVTLSIGVASVLPGPAHGAHTLVAVADAALSEAKRQGRNRVSAVRTRQVGSI